ncbi:MAG: metallophosphoesterase [Paraclostridium sp.]
MIILLFFLGVLVIIIYNVYDNNRVVLVEEEVKIKDLPEVFEGFKILQLSDLHEKQFGDNQEKLLDIINSLEYDMIAITGDMYSSNSKNDKPFFDLLDGIDNKDYMFYVSGNHGPKFSKSLADRGCIPLDKPYEIEVDGYKMVVYDFYDGKDFSDEIKEYDSDVSIAITHYPWDESFYSSAKDSIGNYDLVIAGHYHGGQIRVPFYGAFFVPNLNSTGFLPSQDEVSGIYEYGEYKQYISKGLGANGGSIWSSFRLFNSPEINLIELK